MTPNERSMIEDLFARIRATAQPERDAEAERLIAAEMASTPGAAYALAQTVLVQDQALRQAADQVKNLEEAAKAQPPADAGSILSRVGLGGVRPGAVPRTGQPQPLEPEPPQPAQGGGFLQGALQTAAGVAGGALLFEGVKSMFGGAGGMLGGGGGPWGASPTINETVINESSRDNDDDDKAAGDKDDDDDRGGNIREACYDGDDDGDDGDWSDDGFDGDDSV